MKIQWLTIKQFENKAFSAYVSLPPAGTGPGLILLQEIWGVNAHIKAVADQYAMSGFVVMAPDIYWRMAHRVDLPYTEAGNYRASNYKNELNFDLATQDLTDALAYFRALPAVKGKVGVLGFCMGGQLAFRMAANTNVDAAVCYYGGGIDKCLDLSKHISQAIMFHHATDDSHIPLDTQHLIRQAFHDKNNARFYDYPNSGHGFNCWARPHMYQQKSAALAQGRTLEFLANNL